MIVTINH